MGQLVGLYLAGVVSTAVGVVVLVWRRRLAAFNADALKEFASNEVGSQAGATSRPWIFVGIGIMAIAIGVFVVACAVLVSLGVLMLEPPP